METKLAINILEKTFKQKFDIERFEYFLTELFNDVEINTVEEKQFVKDNLKKYVNHFYTIGNYRSKYDDRIGLYAVELSNESSRDRARTMQRNLIAKVMGKNREAALVAFYSKDSDDWRFSYIKKYYKFGENGIKEELSAPRRHSFLVGPNEPNHTCQKQFLSLLISEDKISLEEIDEAFNIENVTDEFFKEYSDLVKSLVDSLTKIKEKDSIVREEFDSKYIKSSDFAKKLMGQLVFMYFLQKKGWLGVQKGNNWGTGPKNFLRGIFNKCQDENKNFFNDVLEPLFYKGFAEEVSDFHYSEFGYMVPFLNGALFEPINNYDWEKTDINLTNSIFKNIFKTFDKFNFTVKEDEPLEKEVAVDPEMLGKVFESLLEGGDRKQKGAFYTPRHIVHYMCQENLISYLETNTDIPEEDLRKFITKGYLAIEHIIQVNDAGKKLQKIPHIRESIKENSDKLDNLLKNVKIIDPAVGSGAFPVGMMNEIVTARYILRLINNVQDIDFYNLKKETIANSLYGVDLELSATDVTKLRFWLSLIVDEENIKEIEPLPNLDNQIMCGNSVIDGYENVRLFDDELIVRSAQTKLAMTPKEQLFEKIESKKREFFNTCGPLQKEKLRREIKELKWQFIEEHLKSIGRKDLIEKVNKYKYRDDRPFFIWELEFSEIFKGENPGFDIVIGNPPYVRNEKIKEIKPYLESHYKTYHGNADLYVYFFEKGLKILKDEGIFAFICSNKFA
ncbi:MAG: Eco57I restriction-modification methylase domain-containing protein, partial [Methanobrevibacter sp.]|uniref:Eco57I restriction-modification methylase domain-containing protein n=1 Tax=Methanobrevibacter sp. TaxID=66852 RepID=UPI0025DBC5EF